MKKWQQWCKCHVNVTYYYCRTKLFLLCHTIFLHFLNNLQAYHENVTLLVASLRLNIKQFELYCPYVLRRVSLGLKEDLGYLQDAFCARLKYIIILVPQADNICNFSNMKNLSEVWQSDLWAKNIKHFPCDTYIHTYIHTYIGVVKKRKKIVALLRCICMKDIISHSSTWLVIEKKQNPSFQRFWSRNLFNQLGILTQISSPKNFTKKMVNGNLLRSTSNIQFSTRGSRNHHHEHLGFQWWIQVNYAC